MNYHVHGRFLAGFSKTRNETAWVMKGRTPFRAIVLLHFAALLHEPHALNFLFMGNHFILDSEDDLKEAFSSAVLLF